MMDMTESIGNVQLDLQYYPGKDYYSDGEIEDILLEYVSNHTEEEYDAYMSECAQWPILYHLSPIRQNIVSSLNISKLDKVLEIGAGCGAITGRLCDMAKDVTCIELSKKRSMINAYRNRDKDNLKIEVGNFEVIEEKLQEAYDWITLIGVYEYAASYISSDDPYHVFLEKIMKHLKLGGTLVIAIENRLGLKYFAGCKEDHVGKYFAGLEGYTNGEGVRTFSKDELMQIFRECGYNNVRFRYPYPDYKFPISIYSDERLPQCGEMTMNMMNNDQVRHVLFDESKFYDAISDTSLYPIFSNSYLIEIVKE